MGRKKAGAPRTYKSDKALREAVDRYFKSISRVTTVKEKIDSGRRDSQGHVIWEEREIINQLGEPVTRIEYAVPPTVQGLADSLGIHRSTWDNYCDKEKHPEFFDTTTRARGRLRAYLESELLTRNGKDLKGVLFNLENNYGMRERKEVELGPKAAAAMEAGRMSTEEKEALLAALAADFAEEQKP